MFLSGVVERVGVGRRELPDLTSVLAFHQRNSKQTYYLTHPGVPSLPNHLKVRSTEIQSRRSLCAALRLSCLHLPIIDTPSAPGASPSQSSPHAPPHEDATTASEPTLSSLAQLSTSASSNGVVPAPSESTSAATKTKEQLRRHYVRILHKVVDESDVVLLVLDARDPAGCRSRLVEEEVRRREAEGKRLVFVLNKIGTCASP